MTKSEDYGLGPASFPRGWFIVADSTELSVDKPQAVKLFGRDLALYRGESGNPVMLDAHCPHMGTHLTASDSTALVNSGQQIEGDSIRCPYHGWRFGPDGQCDDIPYFDGPCPKAAKIRSYPVKEVMGCVMVWFDPEGGEPLFDAPDLPEWNDPGWVQWKLNCLGELDVHPIEVLDNMADVAHLGPTHGAPCEYFENELRDHIVIQRQGGVLKQYGCLLQSTTWYTGPGLLLSKQKFGDQLIYELIANTPVEDGKVRVWHGALVRSANEVATEADIAKAREAQAGALQSFSSDFTVWKNKRPATQIMKVPTDGPFHKIRAWHQQFYCEADKVSELQAKHNGIYHVRGMETPDDDARSLDVGLFD
ncbi:Rieske (2Fe-2S) protein [Pseudomaricurvus alkylphenolicus]|uniref:Rieske 2Fe-2S domain-containing protein n=1 Tax=Pseudomaricurvus alkylphenolicus TaxID=1306991 RepID=UPI00142343E4|nr:Rieske 2Fe-2S domain-containing protein [Pseudomaricurvus alkylphenolicus]NIB37985.1 Rieske (2Fe-2S) protein [Pseudomaricurvus alkylphenolicus]